MVDKTMPDWGVPQTQNNDDKQEHFHITSSHMMLKTMKVLYLIFPFVHRIIGTKTRHVLAAG